MNLKTEHNEVYKYISKYLKDAHSLVNGFQIFLKEVINANGYNTVMSNTCEDIYSNLIECHTFFDKNDTIFNKAYQDFLDKNRPNVLYPYEKQAIYEYFKKPDLNRKCYKKFGCIYAEKLKINNKEVISIGLSVCNDKDEFSKNVALNLARKRAREYFNKYDIRVTPETKGIPFARMVHVPTKNMYEDKINMFIKRCKRWFKNETILYPTNIIFTEFPDKKKKKSDKITNEPMLF